MSCEHLTYVVEDFIATATIDRPPVNALNQRLVEELCDVCELVRRDIENGTVRVMLILAEGTVFCAGADLKERMGLRESEVAQAVRRISNMTGQIAKLAVPTIAALQGTAVGGGFEIALACDFRIAAENSKVGLSETALGIIPGAGGTQRLSRLIGRSQALFWIATSRLFSAPDAKEFGAVDVVTKQAELRSGAYSLAGEIASNGPLAVQTAKLAVSEGTGLSLEDGLKVEAAAYDTLVPTQDRREGLQAFLQKRRPLFTGK